jgi:DNA-binding CsgD family transcriptional regulator
VTPAPDERHHDGLLAGVATRFATSHALSPRETAVLLAIASGVSRKEVAWRLGCSPGTIHTYWRRLLRKTGSSSQSELFAALIRFVLVSSPAPK